jgi:hypothetical protein
MSQRDVDRKLKGKAESSRYTQQVEYGRILPDRESCRVFAEVYGRDFDVLWGQVMRAKASDQVLEYFEEQLQIASSGELRSEAERGLFTAMRSIQKHYDTDVTSALMGLLTSSITMGVKVEKNEAREKPLKVLATFLSLYSGLPLDVQRIVLEDCQYAAQRATRILMRTRTSVSVGRQ